MSSSKFSIGLGAAAVVASLVLEDPTAIQWTLALSASLLSLALFGPALVCWLWFSALKAVSLNRANVVSFLVPVFGLTMGLLLYDERLSWFQLSGVALALLGIVLVNWNRESEMDSD